MTDNIERSRIWRHARALNKALIGIAPKDFCMQWNETGGPDTTISVSCTIATTHEAEAVCEIIMHLARQSLSARREMILADIMEPKPEPSWREKLAEMFGDCVVLNRDSGSGSQSEDAGTAAEAVGPQSGPKGIAQTSPTDSTS